MEKTKNEGITVCETLDELLENIFTSELEQISKDYLKVIEKIPHDHTVSRNAYIICYYAITLKLSQRYKKNLIKNNNQTS